LALHPYVTTDFARVCFKTQLMTQSSIPVNVPIPPMPPGIIALQYSPIWYQNAPSPLPPVTASLPRDRTAIKEHAEKRQLQEKERQLEAKKSPQSVFLHEY